LDAGAGTVFVLGPVAGAGATLSGGGPCAQAIPANNRPEKTRLSNRIDIDIDEGEVAGIDIPILIKLCIFFP
jgi:hypothetical protein